MSVPNYPVPAFDTSNQMTGFCMECNTVLKQEWVKLFDVNTKSRSQNKHIKMDQLTDFVQSH